jgi:hypothetical protein
MFRKGQVEMIGLVIVVVLIAIGGLFYVKFAMISDENKVDFRSNEHSIRANNLMGALANLELCEGEISLREMFAMIGPTVVCDGKTAQEYLDQEIPLIFEATGLENYRYWVVESGSTIFEAGDCEYGIESAKYAFSYNGRTFESHLRFCS